VTSLTLGKGHGIIARGARAKGEVAVFTVEERTAGKESFKKWGSEVRELGSQKRGTPTEGTKRKRSPRGQVAKELEAPHFLSTPSLNMGGGWKTSVFRSLQVGYTSK